MAHLQQNATTTCRLLKIILKSGFVYGLATLDKDVAYDDGGGVVNYSATNGFDPSTFSTDTGYSVDNAEGYALITQAPTPGVNTDMVNAGEFDDAQWICYLVNFEDLSMGHIVLDAGDVGEVRTKYGMIWIPELLSYMMRLKQPVGSVYSRTCRAIFGSHAAQQTGCGVALGPLWVNGSVVAVGAETDRIFTASALSTITPMPGRVQWLTGDNAGKEFATEDVEGMVVTLNETTAYAIQVGDTYRIRPDCLKRYHEDCIGVWSNGPNFKGEPLIPVGDSSQVQTPGAQLPGGGGYVSADLPEGDTP
jgi:uncharacterized phage protein (TIGR02218 family)